LGVRCASVFHDQHGYHLEVEEVPWTVLLAGSALESAAEWLSAVTRHRICCQPPEWTWHVGWGHAKPGDPDYDKDDPDWLRSSLGSWLNQAQNWMLFFGYSKRSSILTLPLSPEQVIANFPEWRDDVLERNAEEEEENS
jgi:hypothetical protein